MWTIRPAGRIATTWAPRLLAALAVTACGDDGPGGGTDGGSDATATATVDPSGSSGSTGDPSTTAGATDPGGTETGDGTTGGTTGDGTTDGTTGPVEPGCGDGVLDPGEECDDGNDNSFDGCTAECEEVAPLDPPPLEWKYFDIEGTACLNGSTAGFAINYNPDSPNVMIYLEGGGACFNDACDFTAFNIPFVPPIDGIFNRGNNNNPVRDWTMVYVPYCTGDIHAGDNEYELSGDLRFFHGYSNVTRYLEVLVQSFETERVLLTGISAGGFGAAINASQVADAYGDAVITTVIDDSGPPLSNDVIAPCLQETFREVWGLDGTALADCPECDPNNFATGLLDHVLETHPGVRYGLFSNTSDLIIRTYMGFGWGGGEHDNCEGVPTAVPAQAYSLDLDTIRAAHGDKASTFYVNGVGHTVLRVGYYLTSVGGTSVPEWVGDVLDGQVTHVGP
ncbi:MAG: hypothetical protein H6713_29455 [Myxococcales bacterium]|nr:hypothetical protein [Myxococcales bacterium]